MSMNPYTGCPDWEPAPYVMAEIDRHNQELDQQEKRSHGTAILGLCFIFALLYAIVIGFLRTSPGEYIRHAPPPAVKVPVTHHTVGAAVRKSR